MSLLKVYMEKQMKQKIKTKGLYLNGHEAVMPSSLTQSKIFSVMGKNNLKLRQQKTKYTEVRTKNEAHTYTGYKLDIKYDYPIYHYLLREKQLQGSTLVTIDFNLMLDAIGKQIRPENRKALYNRIKQFKYCEISVTKYAGNEEKDKLPLVDTSFILEIRKISEFVYTVLFSKEVDELVNDFDTQKIDLVEFKKLKKRPSMAIYLQIKSYGYIRSHSINILFDKFKVHYDESRTNRQIRQDLLIGFNELKEKGMIKEFEEGRTKETKEKTFKIIKIKKNSKAE